MEKVGGQSVLREPPASHRVNKVPAHLKADWQLVSEGIKAINIEEQEEDLSNYAVLHFAMYLCSRELKIIIMNSFPKRKEGGMFVW